MRPLPSRAAHDRSLPGDTVNLLQEHDIDCPCCGESITLLIDCSEPRQTYVEDCQVCCQPILVDVEVGDDGDVAISTRAENG